MAKQKKPSAATEAGTEENLTEATTEEVVADDTPDEPIKAATEDMPKNRDTAAEDTDITDIDHELSLENPESNDVIPEAEEIAEPAEAEPLPPARTEQVVVRKGGFFPMVLGGLVAAGIGFGTAKYILPEGWPHPTGQGSDFQSDVESKLKGQSEALDKLNARIDALSEGPDLSSIEANQSDQKAAIDGLTDQLGGLETRLTTLEQRPAGEGISVAEVATYASELQSLKAALAEQKSQIDTMSAQAERQEQIANENAQATLSRAALTRVQTALDIGSGFAPALADLEAAGIAVPEALTRVADTGVSSLSDLQQSLPDAARAALAASRAANSGTSEGGGFASFLRNQLGTRSLEAREGNDPDAVLSRVEAATREGRLNDALAEIEALPEVGRAELSDWSGRVARRLEAVAAAEGLGEELN